MKAMIIKEFGGTELFESAELAKPEVKAGHVVKVAATSVNTVDMMIRQMGTELGPLAPQLPAVLGMDFAGVVESVGKAHDRLASGKAIGKVVVSI